MNKKILAQTRARRVTWFVLNEEAKKASANTEEIPLKQIVFIVPPKTKKVPS